MPKIGYCDISDMPKRIEMHKKMLFDFYDINIAGEHLKNGACRREPAVYLRATRGV